METKHHIILSAPAAQNGDQTQNNPTRRKWFALALGGFLFTSIFALLAPPVEAQCQQWNVGHGWRFKQGPTNVDMNLHQNGTVVTGTASHVIRAENGGRNITGAFIHDTTVSGDVDGTVKGDHFAVHIHWNNNTTGVYNGTIRPSGKIEGTGYNQATPSQKVNWYSETSMECADAAAAPIKSSASVLKGAGFAKPKPATSTQLPVYGPTPTGGGGFYQMHTPAPSPEAAESASAEADESSSNDTEDQHGKHKKNKNKKKHHHHHDDDQNQGND